MKLIVGLGNPGPKYEKNRHNLGFMAIDRLADKLGVRQFKEEHKALVAKTTISGHPVILAKPQTLMNLSGDSVVSLLDYYKVENTDLLVAHDEIDIPFLALKFQTGHGHGGHNGIRSIHAMLNTDQYDRLKLGVGRSPHPNQDVADFVLEDFTQDQARDLASYLEGVADAIILWTEKGLSIAATRFNRGPKEK